MVDHALLHPSKTRVDKAGERLSGWMALRDRLTEQQLYEEVAVVRRWREQHAYPMTLAMPALRNWVARYSTLGPPAQRLKRLIQIAHKLQRHEGMKLSRMQDIGGCRAVVDTPGEVEAIAAKIRQHWNPKRESDYRDAPRPTGYRALHLMVEKRDNLTGQPRTIEIQLRTMNQHIWAEEVARTGRRLGHGLQDGKGPDPLREYFRMASALLWLRESGRDVDEDFADRFSELREQVRPYFVTNT